MERTVIEYQIIKDFYGLREAARHHIPLINHIDQGLWVLTKLEASEEAKAAFCLHPMTQDDKNLALHLDTIVKHSSPLTVAYMMEYRNFANQWLSDKVRVDGGINPTITYDERPKLSPIDEVNNMLRADKIQNYASFLLHHKSNHRRSGELTVYFETWLDVLGVVNFQQWFDELRQTFP